MKNNILNKYRKSKWKMDYFSREFFKSTITKAKCSRNLKKKVKRIFEKDMNKE